MSIRISTYLLCPLLPLAGCVTALPPIAANSVVVADAITLVLPHPNEFGSALSATQILSGSYEGESFNMQLELEWRSDAIVVAALGQLGNLLFSMSYDGRTIETVGNRLVLRDLDTSYVLADILLTYCDKGMLDSHLRGAGLEVRDGPNSRAIVRNGTPVIMIEYEHASRWNGRVRYAHLERGYSYEIETLALETT